MSRIRFARLEAARTCVRHHDSSLGALPHTYTDTATKRDQIGCATDLRLNDARASVTCITSRAMYPRLGQVLRSAANICRNTRRAARLAGCLHVGLRGACVGGARRCICLRAPRWHWCCDASTKSSRRMAARNYSCLRAPARSSLSVTSSPILRRTAVAGWRRAGGGITSGCNTENTERRQSFPKLDWPIPKTVLLLRLILPL